MIQEIKPYTFRNEYRQSRPEENDFVFCVRENQFLMSERDGDIGFPTYGELSEAEQRDGQFTYLFALDQRRFFLHDGMELPGYEYRTMQDLRGAGPKHLAYAGLVAMQLSNWHDSHRFCGRCGHRMEHDSSERMMRCPSCGQMEYPKICPCVIVGVVHEDQILVTKYRGRRTGHYALVAGFAEVGETIEETVHREVFEETGVHVKNLRYYKCQPWPFSESLLFGFFCELDGSGDITMQEDELSMAKWISREELDVECDDFALTNEMLCVFKEDRLP